jgi:hypothetical protein
VYAIHPLGPSLMNANFSSTFVYHVILRALFQMAPRFHKNPRYATHTTEEHFVSAM